MDNLTESGTLSPKFAVRCRGFSLVEILAITAALFVVGSIAIISFANIKTSADEVKLASDVKTLNSAVKLYSAFGSLQGITNPQEVLDKLKSVVNEDLAHRMPGTSSSVVDPRLEVVTVSGIPENDFAEWNPDTQTFELVTDRKPTQIQRITAFVLGDEPDIVASEIRDPHMMYSEKDGWVWDYQERTPGDRIKPTLVATSTPPPHGIPSTAPSANQLAIPQFSIVEGSYPASDFDLSLTLGDPNPPGTTEIQYSVNGGSFSAYSGPISVAPDDTVSAYSRSLAPASWTDSATADETYTATADPAESISFSMSAASSP